MKILAIDPGSELSAYVGWDTEKHEMMCNVGGDKILGIELNKYMVNSILWRYLHLVELVAIEMISCYGFAVGREIFETVRWIGRFEQTIKMKTNLPVGLYARSTIKGLWSCKNDAEIRQAIRQEYGEAKKGMPLEGVKKDMWQALALAIALDKNPNLKEW